MPDDFKRHVAFKLRIGEILLGKPIIQEEKFKCLELGNKQIVRVNVIANVIEKYDSEGESTYTFSTIDDGSGQIKLKAFGDDAQKLKPLTQGQTILVIGLLRYFNNEIYIAPEIVKEYSAEYLLIRKLETEKEKNTQSPTQKTEQTVGLKDKILDLIKNSESDGGIETDKIIMSIRETTPDMINQEIKKLLEEGIIFEPRPGKLRFLG